jgi:hypothetical protein
VEEHALAKKRQEAVDRFVASLAQKYGVKVQEPALRRVSVMTTNMFTFRNIGFGGRIVAAPMTQPQTGWVKEWVKKGAIAP